MTKEGVDDSGGHVFGCVVELTAATEVGECVEHDRARKRSIRGQSGTPMPMWSCSEGAHAWLFQLATNPPLPLDVG